MGLSSQRSLPVGIIEQLKESLQRIVGYREGTNKPEAHIATQLSA